MSIEIAVLRSLLHLARRRTEPSLDRLVTRVGSDETTVRRALFSLAKKELIQRTPAGLRLSLMGFAVAVAYQHEAKARAKPLRDRDIGRAVARRRAA